MIAKNSNIAILFLGMYTIGVVTGCDSDGVNRVICVDACSAGGGGARLPITRLC